MARVAHPLLLPVETIHEEPAEPHLPLEQLQGEESPRPPLVRGRWQYRSVLDEGVWEEGVHMRVLTLPAAPFRIIEASPGWLGFCGFRWGEVKGCTLRIVQGEKTEFHQVRHMLDRAAAGEAAQVVVTNYTKNGIEFSNHVLVSPIFDLNGLLRCFDVTTERVTNILLPTRALGTPWQIRCRQTAHPLIRLPNEQMQVYQAHGENGQSRQAQPQSIPASIVSDLADLHSATMPSPSIWFALLDQCRLSGRAFVHSIANLRHKGACSAHAREEVNVLRGQDALK